MEVTATSLPDTWAVFCGLADVVALLEDLPVTVDAMPEGTVFYRNEPVLRIAGKYRDFCRYETAILGFLCHASGIASAAAHIRHRCPVTARSIRSVRGGSTRRSQT